MNLSGWALRNKHLVWFLVVALAVGGIVSVGNMSKLEDPEIKVKNALVVTTYPGASAHEVELELTEVLEKRIRTMKGLRYVKSQSYSDLSIISVVLEQTVPDDEVEQHYDMLRCKVSDAVLPAFLHSLHNTKAHTSICKVWGLTLVCIRRASSLGLRLVRQPRTICAEEWPSPRLQGARL